MLAGIITTQVYTTQLISVSLCGVLLHVRLDSSFNYGKNFNMYIIAMNIAL